MLKGHQTWVYASKPTIIASAAVGGPYEAKGNLASDFDLLHGDIRLGQDSFEKAEQKLQEQACEIAIKKAKMKKEDVQFLFGEDLIIGQLMLDGLKLTPAHTTSTLVVVGAILGGLGLYEPLVKFAGAGATVPISSFGNSIVKGL